MDFRLFKQTAAEVIGLLEMKFAGELNMEAFIIENPQVIWDEDEGRVEILRSQLHIPGGRKGGKRDGRIDLLGQVNSEFLDVIELKNDMVKEIHLRQLEEYLDRVIEEKARFFEEHSIENGQIRGVIIGTGMDDKIKGQMSAGYLYRDVPIIGMVINRYSSLDRREIFVLSERFMSLDNDKYIKMSFPSWDDFIDFQKNKFFPFLVTNV